MTEIKAKMLSPESMRLVVKSVSIIRHEGSLPVHKNYLNNRPFLWIGLAACIAGIYDVWNFGNSSEVKQLAGNLGVTVVYLGIPAILWTLWRWRRDYDASIIRMIEADDNLRKFGLGYYRTTKQFYDIETGQCIQPREIK